MGKEKCLGSSFTRVTQAFPATQPNRWLQPTGQWNILKHPNSMLIRYDGFKLNLTIFYFPSFVFLLLTILKSRTSRKMKVLKLIRRAEEMTDDVICATISAGSGRWVFLFVFSPVSTHKSRPRSYQTHGTKPRLLV